MKQKLNKLIFIISIFFAISLNAQEYRVSVAILLHQKEITEPLKKRQQAIKQFFRDIAQPKTPLKQQYKNKLKTILNALEKNGLGKKGWGTLNRTKTPFHITLAYIDDLLDETKLNELKQALTRAAQQISIKLSSGLGNFYIEGSPFFIGEHGWVAYPVTQPCQNLHRMAEIILDMIHKQNIKTSDKPFYPHISIGLIGNMRYPPDAAEKENPFYAQLLKNHAIAPHNSLWSGIKAVITDDGFIAKRIKCNVKNFTLKIHDKNSKKDFEQIYELSSGMMAQLLILRNKLEYLKSKLLLLNNRLKALKAQLTP